MKRITITLLFFVALAFSSQAQCPSQAQMVMIGEDTNTVFNVGQGNTNTVPSVMSCTAMAFCVYPQIWSSGSASIYQPCIRTRYNPYFTSVRNNVAETFYENGGFIYDLKPSNPASGRIGGSTPPASGTSLWDFSLYQISTAYTHSISVCMTGAGPISTDSISVRDCWRNTGSMVYAVNPSFNGSSCLTWNDPANSGKLGTTVWTITPAATWPAIYAWTNGMCYIDPRYLTAGTYTLSYTFTPPTGAPTCATVNANYIFTITNPYSAAWTAPANLCSNGSCVNLSTSGTGGGTWSGTGVSGSQFCPSTSGAGTFPVTYTVGISSQCGATQTNNITVTQTPTLSVAGASICSGSSVVLTNGGTSAGSYTWAPSGGSASSATVSPTTSTTYTLTGANGNCSSSTTALVNVTATPTLNVAGGTICSGQSIVLTNTGSTAGSYNWSPSGGSASSATVSPSSTTTFTLSGANGSCTGTTTAVVTVNPTPTISISGAGTICAGGSIVLTGGTANSYTWAPSGGNASTATVSPSSTTTFTLTGTSSGCSSSATAVVNVTPNPTVSISSSASTICSGGSATLTASGATNYTWSPNAGGGNGNPVVVSPSSNDTYTVTGESSGCTTTQVITVNVTATPTINISASSGTICSGQTTTLTASGAGSYTWMPGGTGGASDPVSPSGNTTYTVTGDNAGCTSTQTVAVNVNPLPTISINAAPASICNGQTTTLTASGASTYTWSANAGGGTTNPVSVTPGATDTYTVTGTDNNGCQNQTTLTVNVSSSAVISISATSNTVCAGQSVVLTGGGATNYTWSPGNQSTPTITVTPTSSTTYTLNGDNGSGCSGSQTVSIGVTANPTVTATAGNTSLCSGNSTTITGAGATNYTWMPGGINTNTLSANPSTTTTYTLVGESGGCTSSTAVTVSVTATPTVSASASGGTICAGQSVVLTGSGATTYSWSPGAMSGSSVTVTPSANTTYTLTGANGFCTATATAAVNVTPLPNVTASGSSTGICSGQSAVLTASGATTYTWSSNAGGVNTTTVSVTPSTTDTYTVTGTANGCDNSTQVTINVTPTPTVSASATAGTICAGASTTLNGSGATNYTWLPGGLTGSGISVSPSSNTTYTVIGDTGGCLDSSSTAVNVNPTPTLGSTFALDTARCGAPTGVVTGVTASGGTQPYTYQWTSGGVTISTNDSLLNVPAGVYNVTITDANGCVAQGGVSSFTVPGTVPVSASISPFVTQGQGPLNVNFTSNTSGATSYGWNFGNGTFSASQTPATVTYNSAGTYTVTLLASNGGCWDTAVAYVIVDVPTSIVIPNVFSPNGDGINDDFFIVNTGLVSLTCDIFNRWGQRMFTLNSPQQSWDGKTSNGEKASDGTYFYILSAVGTDGKPISVQGSLTLVR